MRSQSMTTALLALVAAGSAAAQNDECTTALNLPLGVATAFDTTVATLSAPAWPCAASTAPDLWYSVTATQNALLTIETCGSGYDTALEVFTGTCAGLVPFLCNDDVCGLQSRISFAATSGTTYLVRVGGFTTNVGTGTIIANHPLPVTNDECNTAIGLTLSTPVVFDTTNATLSAAPWSCAGSTAPDIWYTYTATNGNQLDVETCGSSYDTAIEVFDGSCGVLNSVVCNDDSCGLQSVASFVGTPGTTYFIRVGGYLAAFGTGTVEINESLPPNITQNNGAPPSASTTLTFDSPVVPSGPIAPNSTVFTGVGITSINLVGTWNALGDAMTVGSNVSGQGLVSQGGALTIAGPNEALDNPTAGAGFDIRLNAPTNEFGILFVDQVGFTYDIEVYLGANLIGNGQFVYGPANAFPSPPDYWVCAAGPFDRIVITDTFGGGGWGIDDIAFGSGVPTVGTPYCTANNNSTGVPSRLTGSGSAVVASNNLTLEASDLPLNSFGFFLTSASQGTTPNPGGSQGILCLGGQIGRYVGPGQIKNSGATGSFSLTLNLNQIPTPNGFVAAVAGQTRNFQTWHRDLAAGTPTSNFSNGLFVTFQ
jgi:hypothetical protein